MGLGNAFDSWKAAGVSVSKPSSTFKKSSFSSLGSDVSILRKFELMVKGDVAKIFFIATCVERAPDAYTMRSFTGESKGQE